MPEITDVRLGVEPDNCEASYDFGFPGHGDDERIRQASTIVSERSYTQKTVAWDPDQQWYLLDQEPEPLVEEYPDWSGTSAIANLTGLNFAETLAMVMACERRNLDFLDALYWEPEYYQPAKLHDGLDITGVEISQECSEFTSFPQFARQLNQRNLHWNVVSFLGFESNRYTRLNEVEELSSSDFFPVVAAPAFKPGFEMLSLRLHRNSLMAETPPAYVPANNPYQVDRRLSDAFEDIRNLEERGLVVVPLGTKPINLGIATFLTRNIGEPRITFLHDFPVGSLPGAVGVSSLNRYRVSFGRG